MFLEASFCQLCGEDGHGSLPGADVGGGADGKGVRLGHALPFEYRGDECGGETVARSYRVGYLDFWGRLERDVAGCKDVAAVDAASENEHLEIIFA